MGCFRDLLMVSLILLLSCRYEVSKAELSKEILKKLKKINRDGPFVGVLVPSTPLLQPLIQSSSYESVDEPYDHVDYAGRRFHVGEINDYSSILAVTGKGMMNAATTTQVMCTLFPMKGIVHFGFAGNTDKAQNVGNIVIPQHWAHTGIWNWQRYGDGPEDPLSLEEDGDFTRDYGYLNFGDFTNKTNDDDSADNFLNNIWYQAEEIFHSAEGSYSRSKIFWVPVSQAIFEFAKKLEEMELEGCIDESTCLKETPKVVRVKRGSSANMHLDNAAYKDFLNSKFQVSIVDMESAAIALISHQQQIPFLSMKALFDQEKTFTPLHVQNLIEVLLSLVKYVHKDLPDATVSSM